MLKKWELRITEKISNREKNKIKSNFIPIQLRFRGKSQSIIVFTWTINIYKKIKTLVIQ